MTKVLTVSEFFRQPFYKVLPCRKKPVIVVITRTAEIFGEVQNRSTCSNVARKLCRKRNNSFPKLSSIVPGLLPIASCLADPARFGSVQFSCRPTHDQTALNIFLFNFGFHYYAARSKINYTSMIAHMLFTTKRAIKMGKNQIRGGGGITNEQHKHITHSERTSK